MSPFVPNHPFKYHMVSNPQEDARRQPCTGIGETDSLIAEHSCRHEGCSTAADQLHNAAHHGHKAETAALKGIPKYKYHSQ